MYYWNNWYTGWGWFLWFGVFLLFFSSIGNWGYTYSAHRRFGEANDRDAMSILNERYARGEVDHEMYLKMKSNILSERREELSERDEKRQADRGGKNTSTLQPTY